MSTEKPPVGRRAPVTESPIQLRSSVCRSTPMNSAPVQRQQIQLRMKRGWKKSKKTPKHPLGWMFWSFFPLELVPTRNPPMLYCLSPSMLLPRISSWEARGESTLQQNWSLGRICSTHLTWQSHQSPITNPIMRRTCFFWGIFTKVSSRDSHI